MSGARFRLGFGLVSGGFQVYLAVTFGLPDVYRNWYVANICIFALLALMGAWGLVLRRQSARSTVYATENGVHDPQDTGNDQ
jgi:hypothetical protein